MSTRDPFARTELHKTFVPHVECDWCGCYVKVRGVQGTWRYRTEHDSGRVDTERHTFCNRSCRASFGG